MLQIRKLLECDIDAICVIENAAFSMPWSRQAFEDVVNDSKACYVVAEEDGKPVGYCGAYTILDEADINQVAVDENYRKRGIATAMLQELLQKLQRKGIRAVTLEVRKSNQAAISLYEGLGFVTEGVRKEFYEKPKEDALIMWKR